MALCIPRATAIRRATLRSNSAALTISHNHATRSLHGATALFRPSTPRHSPSASDRVEDVRNIGIIAHVDAGKTTTTEKMLYFSGTTRSPGEVGHGNTVTDFLPMERTRGITVQSAAVTFHWPPLSSLAPGEASRTVNLIDTPGHQDFRFEVDRCIPVLDGAVCILDAKKGVEPHTERVWASAQKFRVPRIVFANKVDDEPQFRRAVLEIASQLGGFPLLCQIPWWHGYRVVGIIDVVAMKGYRWHDEHKKSCLDWDEVKRTVAKDAPAFADEMDRAREKLMEAIADRDETFMNQWSEDARGITTYMIKDAIRRLVEPGDGRLVPVFLGSAKFNVGVELLMDAVVEYLPSPLRRPPLEVTLGSKLTANLADVLDAASNKKSKHQTAIQSVSHIFKVFNHETDGILCLVRVYHGTLDKKSPTWNTRIQEFERPMGIEKIFADKTEEIATLSEGYIGAVRGLKKARTGDTLLTTLPAQRAPSEVLGHMHIRPPELLPSVASLAIDTYSRTVADKLEQILDGLSREDPSLRWARDDESDQFIIQGMGLMHLEVAQDNIKRRGDIADKVTLGEINVEYREAVTTTTRSNKVIFEKTLAGRPGKVTVTATIEPRHEGQGSSPSSSSALSAALPPNSVIRGTTLFNINLAGPTDHQSEAHVNLLNGARASLARGPRRGFSVEHCHVTLDLDGSPGAVESPTPGHYASAARVAVQEALRAALARGHVCIMEPIMLTELRCLESCAGDVLHDIASGAGGQVVDVTQLTGSALATTTSGVDDLEPIDTATVYAPSDPYRTVSSLRDEESGRADGAAKTMVQITAKIPLVKALAYDAHLRSITGSTHSMATKLDSWRKVVGARDKSF